MFVLVGDRLNVTCIGLSESEIRWHRNISECGSNATREDILNGTDQFIVGYEIGSTTSRLSKDKVSWDDEARYVCDSFSRRGRAGQNVDIVVINSKFI